MLISRMVSHFHVIFGKKCALWTGGGEDDTGDALTVVDGIACGDDRRGDGVGTGAGVGGFISIRPSTLFFISDSSVLIISSLSIVWLNIRSMESLKSPANCSNAPLRTFLRSTSLSSKSEFCSAIRLRTKSFLNYLHSFVSNQL